MPLHPAMLWELSERDAVRCTACSLYCTVKPDRAGICAVRVNRDGKLYSLVYGRAAAIHVDPIEKKPLFHFYPGHRIFSVGTVGCNFRCTFCQNWDISQWARNAPRDDVDAEGIYGRDLSPEQLVDAAHAAGCTMMAYTYNEPTIFIEYAYDACVLAHERGMQNVFVSNGFITAEALALLEPVLDAINVDLKGFNDRRYRRIVGAPLQPVLDGLRMLAESRIWLEVTSLIIPDHNDSDAELAQLAEFVAGLGVDVPWHVSRFRPDYQMLDRGATPPETLHRAYNAGKQAGLEYVYVGNLWGDDTESTFCPGCGACVIERRGYVLRGAALDGARCAACAHTIAGVGLETTLLTAGTA